MEVKGLALCHDPVWMKDAVSKFLESPVYSVPLLDFIDENCGMFEDSEDNKLEYTIVHENFKELVDGLISDFLNSLEIPIPTFVQMLANEVHSSLYSIVVTSILTVDDFLLFKEMMLKRNYQISNQILNQVANHPEELEKPADLNSVIDHLSDISKQKHRDKKAAECLSFVDAFQQQAQVEDNNVATKPLPTMSFSNLAIREEGKKDDKCHIESYDQHIYGNFKYKKESIVTPPLKECRNEVVKPTFTSNNFYNKEELRREPSILLSNKSNKIEIKEGNSKCNKNYILDQKPIFVETLQDNVYDAMENQKENTRITKVTFESPCEVVILDKLIKKPFDYEGDSAHNFNDNNCINEEMLEQKNEQVVELSTSKMLEDLFFDVNQWKPKSLKLNTNDGEIQQRRRYLQQQRDRILAHKKFAREKQIRFFRQLEAKDDTILHKSRRPTMPILRLSHDIEANRKREALRKELARCLKEELRNKTSKMSTTSKQIQV